MSNASKLTKMLDDGLVNVTVLLTEFIQYCSDDDIGEIMRVLDLLEDEDDEP
jgi:hypothetical protein